MIEATINGDPVTGLQAVLVIAFYTIPWVYGVWMLAGNFVDWVIEPALRWIARKMLCG